MIMKILSTILLTLLIVLGACTSPQVSPDPFVRVSVSYTHLTLPTKA